MKKFKYGFNTSPTDEKRFYILSVPIFRTCMGKGKEKVVFDLPALNKIVENFEAAKVKGFLPVLHFGHNQKSTDDKEACGLLDNFRVEGDFLLADLININQEDFEKLAKMKYPYRSVEIFAGSLFIKSCALLSSQPPQFLDLGILSLEPGDNQERIDNYMADELENGVGMETYEKSQPATEKKEPSMSELMEKLVEIISLLKKDIVQENMDMTATESLKQGASVEKYPGVKPRSMNYQADDPVLREISSLRAELQKVQINQKQDGLFGRLQEVCTKNGLNFQEASTRMMKFSTLEGKEDFLKVLSSEMVEAPHISGQLLKFSVSKPSTPAEKNEAKLKKEYLEGLANPATAVIFKRCYKDANDYVKFHMENN